MRLLGIGSGNKERQFILVGVLLLVARIGGSFVGENRRVVVGQNGINVDVALADQIKQEIQSKAEQGNAEAQYKLGLAYINGNGGLPRSNINAVQWYQKAADQGFAPAQCNLGIMYYEGKGGLAQSYKNAVE